MSNILIVEDEAVVAEDVAAKLRRLGHKVAGMAVTAEEALEMCARLCPDLVLMDIQIKGESDGIEAGKAIHSRQERPVIYMTAHSEPATLARAKVTGPLGYILKPIDERDLATQIELALYKHESDQAVQRLNRELERRVEKRTEELTMLRARLAEAQEAERHRIAVGLHESVCQLIAAGRIKLVMARESADREELNDLLDAVDRILVNAGQEVRDLTFELSSPALSSCGFAAAVQDLCAQMTERYGVRFDLCGAEDGVVVPEPLRPALYSSLRELLFNVAKHAGTDRASVTLEMLPGRAGRSRIQMRVRDYGAGFDSGVLEQRTTRNGGFGLRHLRERMKDLGGTLRLTSTPGQGVEAVIELELERAGENGRDGMAAPA